MKLKVSHVNKRIRQYRKALQLSQKWRIEVEICQTDEDMGEDNRDSIGCIDIDPAYYIATIKLNASRIATDKELDLTIAHEIAHLFVKPLINLIPAKLAELSRIAEERACEDLARLLTNNR